VQINMLNNKSSRETPRKLHSESGVTILEMVVAMLILTVGLLGLAASIGYAVTVSNKGRNLTNSKLLVVSLLEQMETLRNTEQLTFGQIANQGQVVNTGATRNFVGFPTAFQPLSINPGPDGISGTADDLISPGPSPTSVYGDGDDFTDPTWAVPGYSRQITITFLGGNPNIKRIQVILRYTDAGGQIRDMVGVSYLNNDTRSNFR
jgi:type II secretory pathway pseudopilin PulG